MTTIARFDATRVTEAVLRLESKRDKAVEYVAGYAPLFASNHGDWSAYGMDGQGLAYVLGQLALMDAPPGLRSVKDALLTVYRLELHALAHHGDCTYWSFSTTRLGGTGEVRCSDTANLVFPSVTKDNVESAIDDPKLWMPEYTAWVVAQRLRAKTYERWSEVVEGVGIDLTGYPYNSLK